MGLRAVRGIEEAAVGADQGGEIFLGDEPPKAQEIALRQIVFAAIFCRLGSDLVRPPLEVVVVDDVVAQEDVALGQPQGLDVGALRVASHERRIEHAHQAPLEPGTERPRFTSAHVALGHHHGADAKRFGREQRREGLLR